MREPDEAATSVASEQKGEKEDATVDDEGRPRFVGDLSIKRDGEEPILRESGRRFVLFPIQYHEVLPSLLPVCVEKRG